METKPEPVTLTLGYIKEALKEMRSAASDLGTWMDEPQIKGFEDMETDGMVPSEATIIIMEDGTEYILTLQQADF